MQALGNEDSTGKVCGLRVSKCQRVEEQELVSIKPGHAASAVHAEYHEDPIAESRDKRHSERQICPKGERRHGKARNCLILCLWIADARALHGIRTGPASIAKGSH